MEILEIYVDVSLALRPAAAASLQALRDGDSRQIAETVAAEMALVKRRLELSDPRAN